MSDKYEQLKAAIAAVRKVNADFLEILPTRRDECGDETSPPRLAEKVAAFFRDHGQEAEEAIAAFLDALARFTFDEFPRNWPEVYYMVHSSRRIMWRLHRQHFPENELIHQLFHEDRRVAEVADLARRRFRGSHAFPAPPRRFCGSSVRRARLWGD